MSRASGRPVPRGGGVLWQICLVVALGVVFLVRGVDRVRRG